VKNRRSRLMQTVIWGFVAVLLSPTVFAQNTAPVAWWKFDEGSGNIARDEVSGVSDRILNNHQWLKGVSQAGLKFDGFTTLVERDAKEVPRLGPRFSIEGWVALQSYPWNWVAIVDQEKSFHRGYYFGVDSEGHLGFQLSVWETWHICLSMNRLLLKQWNHVVATYDPLTGVRLYINGRPAGSLAITGRLDPAVKTGLRIGRNFEDLPPTALVRRSASFPAYYSLDGMLDEVKIYNDVLGPDEIANAYSRVNPGTPELAERRWPSLPVTNHFGAVYTSLKLYPEWDALWRTGPDSDVVVSFENRPFHYVFWRGANFGESMVTENGIWVGDQSFESGTKVGTAEHMNDKHNMHSHISIIENTDARVVLHWRYGLVDVTGQFSDVDPLTGWGDWADEYFYIYPNGVAVRYGNIHGTAKEYSFTEPTILLEPGKKPEDYVSLQAATIANDGGETRTYSWDPVSPPFPFPDQPANANIAEVNLKSEYKPFYIYQPGTTLGPYGWPPELRPEYSHFPVWDHWPVNQAPSDGRYALFPDDFASAAVMSPDPNNAWVQGFNQTKSTYFLFGLTKKSAADLASLDLSWLQPPVAKVTSGGYDVKFDPAQKAYVLTRIIGGGSRKQNIDITFAANEKSPIVDPALVIKNWGEFSPTVKIQNREPAENDLRVGLNHRLEGTDLILWIHTESKKAMLLTIQH
jgi:hypothetical protein